MEIKLDKESAAKMIETCDKILKGEPPVAGSANGSAPPVTEAADSVTEKRKAPASGSASGDITSDIPCWCGEPHPYYAPIRRRCGGYGYVDCICGGDFCVCHNHGEVECFGCKDCEGDDEDFHED